MVIGVLPTQGRLRVETDIVAPSGSLSGGCAWPPTTARALPARRYPIALDPGLPVGREGDHRGRGSPYSGSPEMSSSCRPQGARK